ncbi:MAG: transcription elongation protein SprT [Weeksellaceae bacterium]|jgi:hypothetical protein|nr:transcription elongation protein SprT [Weeksellaceae bacterium]MDX9705001.1 transcription elongation protein SprT [Weeksellaceae bacterium]
MNLSALEKYLPKDALPFINSWIDKNPIQIKILPSRKTKLGDYRFLKDLNRHQITIDAYLKPEAFFFVLTHEIAHLLVYNKFKNKVSPHGDEWKLQFGVLLMESIMIYPKELQAFIYKHALNPKASVTADKNLHQLLFLEEKHWDYLVENLNEGQHFILGNKIFEKGRKRKTRYLCKDIRTQKMYLVRGQAVVEKIIEYE